VRLNEEVNLEVGGGTVGLSVDYSQTLLRGGREPRRSRRSTTGETEKDERVNTVDDMEDMKRVPNLDIHIEVNPVNESTCRGAASSGALQRRVRGLMASPSSSAAGGQMRPRCQMAVPPVRARGPTMSRGPGRCASTW